MIGKKFDIEGKIMTLQREEGEFAYFENNVAIKKFLLGTKYDEYLDPSDFFSASGNLNKIAEQLKNTDSKVFENVNTGTQVHSQNLYQNTQDKIVPPVQKYVPEISVNTVNTSHNYNFEQPVQTPSNQNNNIPNNVYQPESPELALFKKLKRSNKVNFDLKIEEMIPTLEFIRMMNENFETSIIDYVSNQAVEKLLKDASSLKKQIKDQLEILVYGQIQENSKLEEIEEEEETKIEINIIEEKIIEDLNIPNIENDIHSDIKVTTITEIDDTEELFEENEGGIKITVIENEKSEVINKESVITTEKDLSADA